MSVGLLILRLVVGPLAFTGPGALSVDQALGISWSGETWGLAALAAGLIGGAIPLIARKATGTSTAPNAA